MIRFFLILLLCITKAHCQTNIHNINEPKPNDISQLGDHNFAAIKNLLQKLHIQLYEASQFQADPNCVVSQDAWNNLKLKLQWFFTLQEQKYVSWYCDWNFVFIVYPEYTSNNYYSTDDFTKPYHRNESDSFSLQEWHQDRKIAFFSKKIFLKDDFLPSQTVRDLTAEIVFKTDTIEEIQTLPWKERFNFISWGISLLVWGYTFSVCPQGHYAVTQPVGINGYATSKPTCKPCDKGTWNTCRYSKQCYFHVNLLGESKEQWVSRIRGEYRDDINFARDDTSYNLIGSCYPCSQAAGVPWHYNVFYNDYGYVPIGISLPFYCPGAGLEPQPCPVNAVSFPDEQGRAFECTCQPGTYDPNKYNQTAKSPLVCLDCPPGYFCKNGDKKICPAETYSPGKVATCIACTKAACPPNSRQLRPMCETGSTKDEILCVNCDECRNFGTNLGGSKYCYTN